MAEKKSKINNSKETSFWGRFFYGLKTHRAIIVTVCLCVTLSAGITYAINQHPQDQIGSQPLNTSAGFTGTTIPQSATVTQASENKTNASSNLVSGKINGVYYQNIPKAEWDELLANAGKNTKRAFLNTEISSEEKQVETFQQQYDGSLKSKNDCLNQFIGQVDRYEYCASLYDSLILQAQNALSEAKAKLSSLYSERNSL